MNNLNTPNEYRGYFISKFATLERSIDLYLASYFISRDTNLMHDLVSILIDRLSFENKRSALKALFDIRNEKDTSNHKKTGIFKKIIDACGELARIRNYFAHYHSVLVSDTMKNDGIVIGLVQFRDSIKIIWYSESQFDSLMEKIDKTNQGIINLMNDKGLEL